MTSIPAKVYDRFKDNLARIQKVIDQAKARDINEADTVVIVSDVLSEMFGYDKYNEITREFAIKNNYCDLAVKVDDRLEFLIEVKAIGITLQDKHYQQALDYGANNGTEWIILTNAVVWKVYKIKFEKPISTELVCEFSFSELKPKNSSDMEKLYILCKEGLRRNAIDEFTQHKMVVNRQFIGAIIQSATIVEAIKKELKKINTQIRIDSDEILGIIRNDVLKREILDSPESANALERYNKVIKKIEKKKIKDKQGASKDAEEDTKKNQETAVAADGQISVESSISIATDY